MQTYETSPNQVLYTQSQRYNGGLRTICNSYIFKPVSHFQITISLAYVPQIHFFYISYDYGVNNTIILYIFFFVLHYRLKFATYRSLNYSKSFETPLVSIDFFMYQGHQKVEVACGIGRKCKRASKGLDNHLLMSQYGIQLSLLCKRQRLPIKSLLYYI